VRIFRQHLHRIPHFSVHTNGGRHNQESSESLTLGLGLRVIHKGRSGYAYSHNLSAEKFRSVALTAAAIARTQNIQKLPLRFRELKPIKNVARVRLTATSHPLTEKIQLVERTYQSALNHHPAIKKVQVAHGESQRHIRIINSEGLLVEDKRPMLKLVVMALAEMTIGGK